MKKIFLLFLLLLVGCDFSMIELTKPHGLLEYSNDDIVWLRHSGSGVEFISPGGLLSFTLVADESIHKADSRIYARVGFYIDGKQVMDDVIDQPKKNFTLESETGAVIKIMKLSEWIMSSCGIIFDEPQTFIAPVPDKELFIEFIGDSITTGYGVEGNRDDRFTTATQNVTKTYAYKTAQALDADFRIQAVSGSGVVSGSTIGEKMPHHVMPLYYDWENAGQRSPDIIVINLGTNDASYTRRDPVREAEFTEAYVAFLKRLREVHPQADIICSLGIMGDTLFEAVEKAVADFGDEKTYALRFDTQREEDGYGADWHPSEVTQEKSAEKLVGRIREIIE